MNYCKRLALLLLLYSIGFGFLSQRLIAASSPEGKSDNPSEFVQQTSPSPSPAAGNSNLDYGGAHIDAKPTTGQEPCELVSNKCHVDVVNLTACVLTYAGDGPMGLLVLNEGDGSLKFNVTTLLSKPGLDDIEVPGHEVKKINVSASAGSTSSIVLKAINWNCTIQLPVPVPIPVGFPFPSYAAYVTPVNGAYVFLATASLIGLLWACCKLGKNKRQSDGIPYQELEMGEQQQSTSSINAETTTDWDQDWDNDWDDEEKSPSGGGSRIGNRRANGSSRFAESNGWGDD